MGRIVLQDLSMTRESSSYIDALHAILKHKGWMDVPKYMLSGMTAHGFRMVVERRLKWESITAYNWMAENFVGADFIGVTASQKAGFSFDATFPLYQNYAIAQLKASIDRGTGAVIWKDGFVLVTGYDDHRQELLYSDGLQEELNEMPYDQFGINHSPYYYMQVIEHRIEMDELAVYKESLLQAIYKWEQHDVMLPEAQYACGPAAYEAIVDALQTNHYNAYEARDILIYYGSMKREISQYIEALASIWPGCETASQHYHALSSIYQQLAELGIHSVINDTALFRASDVEAIIALVIQAAEREAAAIGALKSFQKEALDNRFNNVGLR